jgi:hypothetical protein
MKILFLGSNLGNDYAQDCLFHGLKNLYGSTVVDYPPLNFMYKDAPEQNPKPIMHGKGFTLYYLLEDFNTTDRSNVQEKLDSNYFDLVIFASIRRNFPKVINSLKSIKCPIVLIDGEDDAFLNARLFNKWIYFKRELPVELNEVKNLFPFPFSVPEEKFVNKINPVPQYVLAPLIPYKESTYIYKNDQDYLNMYANSIFGLAYGAVDVYSRGTKPQWDSYRFYEMMSQGCIPLIPDLEKCPVNCCTNLPKKVLIEAYQKYNYVLDNDVDIKVLKDYQKIVKLREFVLQHAKNFCTTKDCAQNLINKVLSFYKLTSN